MDNVYDQTKLINAVNEMTSKALNKEYKYNSELIDMANSDSNIMSLLPSVDILVLDDKLYNTNEADELTKGIEGQFGKVLLIKMAYGDSFIYEGHYFDFGFNNQPGRLTLISSVHCNESLTNESVYTSKMIEVLVYNARQKYNSDAYKMKVQEALDSGLLDVGNCYKGVHVGQYKCATITITSRINNNGSHRISFTMTARGTSKQFQAEDCPAALIGKIKKAIKKEAARVQEIEERNKTIQSKIDSDSNQKSLFG